MKKIITLAFVLGAFAFSPSTLRADGVAVVDLDAVAKELGVLEFIGVTLDNMRFDLGARVQQAQNNLQGQMNQAIKEAGEKPTDEDKRKLVLINRELETQFQQTRAQANQTIQVEKLKMINQFREDLKPIALDVAKKKKLSVVLNTVMPPVYVFDDSVDITKDVVAAAKKAGLTKKAPARKGAPAGKGKGKGKGK